MATATDVRAQVYENLYSAFIHDRPFETLLGEALDDSETDVDVLSGDDWARGDIAEVEETGEQMLVLSVATNTLTVKRSYGRVAATAAADAGLLRKNPRFTADQIDAALKSVLNGLGDWGIHGFGNGTFTVDWDQYYYSLSETDILPAYGVLSVYYVGDNWEEPRHIAFLNRTRLSAGPTEWATATGIEIQGWGYYLGHGWGYELNEGDTVYYTYAQSFEYDTDLTTTIAKLAAPDEEVLVMGAVAKIMGMTIAPATQDPGQRTDRTVPPGQTSRDGRWFQGEFFTRARTRAANIAVDRGQSGGTVRQRRARRWRG